MAHDHAGRLKRSAEEAAAAGLDELVVALVAGGGGAAGRGATATNVGVSDRLWSVHLLGLQRSLPAAEFVAGWAVLSRQRARKDEDEIELLQRDAVRTDEAFRRITSEALGGRTEREVARALAGHLLDAG